MNFWYEFLALSRLSLPDDASFQCGAPGVHPGQLAPEAWFRDEFSDTSGELRRTDFNQI
jgi:hypothetical protein